MLNNRYLCSQAEDKNWREVDLLYIENQSAMLELRFIRENLDFVSGKSADSRMTTDKG